MRAVNVARESLCRVSVHLLAGLSISGWGQDNRFCGMVSVWFPIYTLTITTALYIPSSLIEGVGPCVCFNAYVLKGSLTRDFRRQVFSRIISPKPLIATYPGYF